MKTETKHILTAVFITVLSVIIVVVAVISILNILFNAKINKKEIINQYFLNEKVFNLLKKELSDKEQIKIKKEFDHYVVFYNDNEYKLDSKKKEFESVMNLIKKIDVIYIEKSYYNITINLNSQINFAQSISYIENMTEFKKNHIVIKLEEIKENWYYVEEK